MGRVVAAAVAEAIRAAESGVEYSPRKGALCPHCGCRTRIVTTRPWDGRMRVRYSRCENPRCLLCQMGVSVKSIQEDKAA